MSTPRKRWFKVADSILREDWDDWTLATVVRLMAWLNQRRARDGKQGEEVGEALIGEADAIVITNLKRAHVAVQRLSRLPLDAGLSSARASLEKHKSGSRVRLSWSKYSEFQRAVTRDADADCPNPGTSDSDSDTDTYIREEKTSAGADSANSPATESPSDQSPIRPRKRERPAPTPEAIQFAEDYRSALMAKRPGFKAPSSAAFDAWIDQARLMLEERPLAEARALARWLFEGECPEARFWLPNVLSVPKFRKQYETLAAQRQRREEENEANSKRTGGGNERGGTILDAAQRVLRSYEAAS